MTVKELIEELKKHPMDGKVYRDGGQFKDDYVPVLRVKPFKSFGIGGVEIE